MSSAIEEIVRSAVTPPQEDELEVSVLGRPIEYKPEYKQIALDYLKGCADEWEQLVKSEGKNDVFEYKRKINLPTIEGLAIVIGCSKQAVYRWAKRFPDFRNALSQIMNHQAVRLMNNGLGGYYESRLATALLGANHGVRAPVEDASARSRGNTTINIVSFNNQDTKEVESKVKEAFGLLENGNGAD